MLERLLALTTHLSKDEMEVLCLVGEGLVTGHQVYGSLNPENPDRDWEQEAIEEHRDAINYLSADIIRMRRRQARAEAMKQDQQKAA